MNPVQAPVSAAFSGFTAQVTINSVALGDSLILVIQHDDYASSSGSWTITDSAGNTFAADVSRQRSSNFVSALIYRSTGVSAGTHTITAVYGGSNAADSFGQIAVTELPGSVVLDATETDPGGASTTTPTISSTGTLASANEIAFAVLVGGGTLAGATSPPSGFTNICADLSGAITGSQGLVSYKSLSATTALSVSYGTISGSATEVAAALATYKPSSSTITPVQAPVTAAFSGLTASVTITGVVLGDSLILQIEHDDYGSTGGTFTIADTGSAAFNVDVSRIKNNTFVAAINASATNVAAGTHTITVTYVGGGVNASQSFGQIAVTELPGIVTLDQTSIDPGGANTTTPSISATGTLNSAAEIAFATLCSGSSLVGGSAPPGWATVFQDLGGTGGSQGILSYQGLTSTAAVSASYGTTNAATEYAGCISTYKVAITSSLSAAATSTSIAVGALTAWASVVLTSPLYTGIGGILDSNFWFDAQPQVGTTVYYDPTFITVMPNGEINSTSNNCASVVQFFDTGGNPARGLVVFTPNLVGYADSVSLATGSLTAANLLLFGAAASISTATAALDALSASYLNINYGWLLFPNGLAYVLIQGVFSVNFPYDNTTQMSVTHDGKHVSWEMDGNLMYSVPEGTETFALQLSLFTPGAAVYGLSFDNIATAVTPFTMVPLTSNVACVGTRVAPNGNGTNGFGQRAFTSKASLTQGCAVSGLLTQQSPLATGLIGLALAPAAGDATAVAVLTAGWVVGLGTVPVQVVFGGAAIDPGLPSDATPNPGDVYTVTYDDYWFRWYLNDSLAYSQAAPGVGALFLFGDLYQTADIEWQDISFGPYGQATPTAFVATGTCVTHDSTATKIGGTTNWDSVVYSLNGYTTCHVQGKFNPANSDAMIGLSTEPAASSSYTNANFAIQNAAGGGYTVWESGVSTVIAGFVPAVTDLIGLSYDASNVRYYINGTVVRTTPASALTLFAFYPFAIPGAAISALSFGPGPVFDTASTSMLDPNAASQIASATSAGSVPFNLLTAPANASVLAVTVTTSGYPIGIDISTQVVMELSNAFFNSPMVASVFRDGAQIGVAAFDAFDYAANTAPEGTGVLFWQTQAALIVNDTPPPGTHTYSLNFTSAQASSTPRAPVVAAISFTNSVIKVREYKR